MSVTVFIKSSGNVIVVNENGGGLLNSEMAAKVIDYFGPEERRIDLTSEEALKLKQELELKNVQD